jgi:Ran GTPase-activating protein (RanGAP) involved in mRNA processing and transport
MSDSMLDDSNLVTALRAHGGLELLDLSGNRLRSLSGIERLVTEGRNDKAAPIKTLILNDNRLSSEGPICFIQTLKFNLNLKSLSFRNCNLSESATSLLGPMLEVRDSQLD